MSLLVCQVPLSREGDLRLISQFCKWHCFLSVNVSYQSSEWSHIHPALYVCHQDCWTFSMCQRLRRRRQWHPTPVLLPGKSHGWRSLVGCSPWGREELDRTERLHFHFSLSCTGEGNGNPLQCSCLENPRDGGAWWATVYGVSQSWT